MLDANIESFIAKVSIEENFIELAFHEKNHNSIGAICLERRIIFDNARHERKNTFSLISF